jgi:hypothetical protein
MQSVGEMTLGPTALGRVQCVSFGGFAFVGHETPDQGRRLKIANFSILLATHSWQDHPVFLTVRITYFMCQAP